MCGEVSIYVGGESVGGECVGGVWGGEWGIIMALTFHNNLGP